MGRTSGKALAHLVELTRHGTAEGPTFLRGNSEGLRVGAWGAMIDGRASACEGFIGIFLFPFSCWGGASLY